MISLRLSMICFLICSTLTAGCVSSRLQESSALKEGKVNLTDYRLVTIYESDSASFFELELETLLESYGLDVIGEIDANARAERGELVLGTRANESVQLNQYGSIIRSELVVLLEDVRSDKTLVTASGSAPSRNGTWIAVKKELTKAFQSKGN